MDALKGETLLQVSLGCLILQAVFEAGFELLIGVAKNLSPFLVCQAGSSPADKLEHMLRAVCRRLDISHVQARCQSFIQKTQGHNRHAAKGKRLIQILVAGVLVLHEILFDPPERLENTHRGLKYFVVRVQVGRIGHILKGAGVAEFFTHFWTIIRAAA